MRICGNCEGELHHDGGWEQTARERAGNAVAIDTFCCKGCKRAYRHRVDERFSGDIHQWFLRDEDDNWQPLSEQSWPRYK